MVFFGGRTLFLQFDCFLLDITSFCNFIPKASLWPALGISFNLSFSLPQREEYYEEEYNNLFSYMGPKLFQPIQLSHSYDAASFLTKPSAMMDNIQIANSFQNYTSRLFTVSSSLFSFHWQGPPDYITHIVSFYQTHPPIHTNRGFTPDQLRIGTAYHLP